NRSWVPPDVVAEEERGALCRTVAVGRVRRVAAPGRLGGGAGCRGGRERGGAGFRRRSPSRGPAVRRGARGAAAGGVGGAAGRVRAAHPTSYPGRGSALHEPALPRVESVSTTARAQPRQLVSLGR